MPPQSVLQEKQNKTKLRMYFLKKWNFKRKEIYTGQKKLFGEVVITLPPFKSAKLAYNFFFRE